MSNIIGHCSCKEASKIIKSASIDIGAAALRLFIFLHLLE